MLLLRINLHHNRTRIILTQEILYGIDVMLPHITQSAAVIIPVSPESTMHPMGMIGLEWCGPQPAVIVQPLRNRLCCEVGPAHPVELPVEAGMLTNGNGQGPTQQA